MKYLLLFLIGFLFITGSYSQQSFYDFTVKDIDGNDFPFSQLKGKKVLIVNTASKCVFTPQYAELEQFYNEHKDKNFVIIGFPANNFMGREPGTNEEIKAFCKKHYGVTFPMMSKIDVKGKNIHPVYKWLTKKALNGVQDSVVKWNFQKYLINEEGRVVQIINPKISVNTLKF